MPAKINDEDRALAFAQEQPIPVVEMLINLMSGVVRRRKAAERGAPAVAGALPGASSTRPGKPRGGQTPASALSDSRLVIPANVEPDKQTTPETGQAGRPLETGQASGSAKV